MSVHTEMPLTSKTTKTREPEQTFRMFHGNFNKPTTFRSEDAHSCGTGPAEVTLTVSFAAVPDRENFDVFWTSRGHAQ